MGKIPEEVLKVQAQKTWATLLAHCEKFEREKVERTPRQKALVEARKKRRRERRQAQRKAEGK